MGNEKYSERSHESACHYINNSGNFVIANNHALQSLHKRVVDRMVVDSLSTLISYHCH